MAAIVQPYQQHETAKAVVDEIRERVRRAHAAPVFVGISGIDCAGKSTLAIEVIAEVHRGGLRTSCVSVDDFIIPPDQRLEVGEPATDYFENTFDLDGFLNKVKSDAVTSDVQVVVGEGVFLLRREIADVWDVKVWLQMSPEQAIERGTRRDAGFFGGPEIARAQYLTRFMPAQRHHLERDRPAETADYVFAVG